MYIVYSTCTCMGRAVDWVDVDGAVPPVQAFALSTSYELRVLY